jgi:murein biosynthesis integral membrane protein MurJ
MQMESKTIGERIIKATMSVFIAHLCFKVLGFAQFFVIGGVTETVQWECIYGFAFDGVIFSLFLIGEELIGPALLPVFIDEKEKNSEEAAWLLANTLLTFQLIILGITVLVLYLFPEALTRWITYFNADKKKENFELAVQGVRLMAPALICFSLGSTTYILLNGYKKFFLAAFGDAVWKAFVLISVVIGVQFFGLSWKALVFGVVFGSVTKLITHLVGLVHQLHFFRPSLNLSNPAFKKMLLLMLPLFIGIVFAKGRDFYNNITVLSSLDTDGLIKANAYGRKLFQGFAMIIPYALSIAMFPFFCELVSKDNKEKLGEILTISGRMLLVIFVPMSLVVIIYGPELVKLLVMGKFSQEDAHLAGISMACYSLVLPAYGLEMLLMQAFFARKKMYLITFVGIACSAFSILISYLGVIKFGASGATALIIIASGYVLCRTLKTIILIAVLKQAVPMFKWRESCSFFIRLTIVGVTAAAAVWLAFRLFDAGIGVPVKKNMLILKLVFGGGMAVFVFLAGTLLLKIREPLEMWNWGLKKLKMKKWQKS